VTDAECSTLQCCDNSTATTTNKTSTSPRKTPFHRRSSVGLPSVDDSESENETEQEMAPIKNSKTIVSSSPMTDSSVVVTVHNEK
jgi:hypothetical protein